MTMSLLAKIRNEKGKSAIKKFRKEGLIPAELYGHKVENLHLAVDNKEFKKVFKLAGENTIINLLIEDSNKKEEIPVLIHDVQTDYLTNDIIHVDFYQIRMDEKVKTHVPLEFVGKSPAVENYGGILNKSMNEIEVEALPQDLPPSIPVDISKIQELNQSIYVKDLNIPKGVKVLVDLDTVIATVIPQKEEVVEETIDISAVKVETEEKKLEREREKEKEKE
jgi:large subunit ribosomal protein L25